MSGILAAVHSEIGIAGVAPKVNLYGASSIGIGEQGTTRVYDEIALVYLIKMCQAKVVNISLGYDSYEFTYHKNENAKMRLDFYAKTMENLLLSLIKEKQDFVLCIAAGNQGEFNKNKSGYRYTAVSEEKYKALSAEEKEKFGDYYGYKTDPNGSLCGIKGASSIYSLITEPEVRSRIITVGSVENRGKGNYRIYHTSQVGEGIDILAPGVGIYSTIRTNKYGKKQGTSMASPHVAGVAAMLFSVNPDISGKDVKEIILSTATGEYYKGDVFHKLVNAEAAVEEAIRRTKENALSKPQTTSPSQGSGNIPEGYIPIYTAQDLDNIRNNLSGKYILMNDIDLADWGNWKPIGGDSGRMNGSAHIFEWFYGILDGQGYVIKNMTVDVTNDYKVYAGLFGILHGKVQNLGIINSKVVSTSYDMAAYAGTIAGWAKGAIGAVRREAIIENCYVLNTIVQVTSPSNAYAGGIVGSIAEYGVLRNCYITGNISAIQPTTHSFSGAGSIASEAKQSSLSNCYYNGSRAIAFDISKELNNVVALSDSQMKQQSSFAGFDFTTIWGIDPAINNGYPYLQNAQARLSQETNATPENEQAKNLVGKWHGDFIVVETYSSGPD